MKKFNPNILLFTFAIVFILVGVWGNCFEQLRLKAADMMTELERGNRQSILAFKDSVEDVSTEELRYHDAMMDVNSVKENLLGTRLIEKDDLTVVKSERGSLTAPSKKIPQSDIDQIAANIAELERVTEANGGKFLYCAAPAKQLLEEEPANAENSFKANYDALIKALAEADIPYLDFAESLHYYDDSRSYPFYYTDHHWTVRTAFEAANSICRTLNRKYGFAVDENCANIENYNVQTYENWFLGSFGKKVGTYFTWRGADDFELITPKFQTNLTEEQPFKNQVRSGSFEESVLYMENMEKGHYRFNSYATYSGGDFRLQIMKNNLNPEGKKILMIRDSFACGVAPFLALQTKELHLCDMRDTEFLVGDKLNAEAYIREIKPDYVIVLYSGVNALSESHGQYNFF